MPHGMAKMPHGVDFSFLSFLSFPGASSLRLERATRGIQVVCGSVTYLYMLGSHIAVVFVQWCLCVRDITGNQDLDFGVKASAHMQSLTYLVLIRTLMFSQLTVYQWYVAHTLVV